MSNEKSNIMLRVDEELKAKFQEYANSVNSSLTNLICDAVKEKIAGTATNLSDEKQFNEALSKHLDLIEISRKSLEKTLKLTTDVVLNNAKEWTETFDKTANIQSVLNEMMELNKSLEHERENHQHSLESYKKSLNFEFERHTSKLKRFAFRTYSMGFVTVIFTIIAFHIYFKYFG